LGRDDRHEVEPLAGRAGRLALGHLREAAVDARRVEVQRRAVRARALGVGRERARHQLRQPVELRGASVHRADERARPAADHPVPQLPSQRHWNVEAGTEGADHAAARDGSKLRRAGAGASGAC
jgi:hypothetical protein